MAMPPSSCSVCSAPPFWIYISNFVQAMRQVADVIHAVARRVAIFDRRRKQDEAVRLQGLWLRWELSTFEYLMRVRPEV